MADNFAPRGIPHRFRGVYANVMILFLSRCKAAARRAVASRRGKAAVATLFPTATGYKVLAATGDVAVLRVELSPESPVILKMARTTTANRQLHAEVMALAELAELADGLAPEPAFKIARVLDRGMYEEGAWFSQSLVAGAATATLDPPLDTIVASAADALDPIHRATAISLEDAHLRALVDDPVRIIKQLRPALSNELDQIALEILPKLQGRSLTVSRLHGDFSPTNVLWNADGSGVSGIVDWTFESQALLPEIDLMNFAVSLIMSEQHEELGEVLRRYRSKSFAPIELRAVNAAVSAGPNGLDPGVTLALTWLHHIAAGLTKQEQLQKNQLWFSRNVDPVVHMLAGDGLSRFVRRLA